MDTAVLIQVLFGSKYFADVCLKFNNNILYAVSTYTYVVYYMS